MRHVRTACIALTVTVSGCLGNIGDVPAGTDVPGPEAGAAAVVCKDPALLGTKDTAVRRLTRDELIGTLRSLLGDEVVDSLATYIAVLPIEPPDVETFSPTHSDAHVSAAIALTDAIANKVASDSATRTRIIGACATSAAPPSTCVEAFVKSFGRLAFRRALAADEVKAFVDDYNATDADFALEVLVARLLNAPDVQFVIERGSEAQGNRVRLSDYDVATRLSFALLRRPPDAALLDAAERGRLRDLAGVRAEIRRLIDSDETRATVRALFAYWFDLSPGSVSSDSARRAGIDPRGLMQELNEEALDFIDHVIWDGDGDFSALFNSSLIVPKTERVAAIYGVERSDTPVTPKVMRPGILAHAALLTNTAAQTSPIHRGAEVLKRFLCQAIPPPDASAIADSQKAIEMMTREDYSTRELAMALTSPPACAACHIPINAIGFAFEGYDELGRDRTKEVVYSPDDTVIAEHAIDTSGPGFALGDAESGALAGANDLVTFISRQDDVLAECYARQLLRFTRLRPETSADGCAMAASYDVLRSSGTLVDGLIAMVGGEQIFWRANGVQ